MKQSEHTLTVDGLEVIVIRSARRRRTVTADISGGLLRLRVPMQLSRRELEQHARAFRRRLARRSTTASTDDQLLARARELAAEYFHGDVEPVSVTWSTQQMKRWGSTTPTSGTIRLSARLRDMPAWVVDAVLIHELAHLIESDHGPRFQELVARYPHTARADAFLDGVTWAQQHTSNGKSHSAHYPDSR